MKTFTDLRTNATRPINLEQVTKQSLEDIDEFDALDEICKLRKKAFEEKSVSKKLNFIAHQNSWLAVLSLLISLNQQQRKFN